MRCIQHSLRYYKTDRCVNRSRSFLQRLRRPRSRSLSQVDCGSGRSNGASAMCFRLKFSCNKLNKLSYLSTHGLATINVQHESILQRPESDADSMPIHSLDSTIVISDHAGILWRWVKHFNSVFNQVSAVDQSVLNELPEWETNDDFMRPLDVNAIIQLQSDKAAGADDLPLELFKIGCQDLTCNLVKHFLFLQARSHFHATYYFSHNYCTV